MRASFKKSVRSACAKSHLANDVWALKSLQFQYDSTKEREREGGRGRERERQKTREQNFYSLQICTNN